jgi:hypothetical protein
MAAGGKDGRGLAALLRLFFLGDEQPAFREVLEHMPAGQGIAALLERD